MFLSASWRRKAMITDDAEQFAKDLLADEYAPSLSNGEHEWLVANIARLMVAFAQRPEHARRYVVKGEDLMARGTLLPDCMLPDGAAPCAGYQQLREAAKGIAEHYRTSLNVGPGAHVTRETMLWSRLRHALGA